MFRKGASAVLATHNAIGRSNQTSVAPGSVAFIPHHQPHRTHWQGEGELLNIYFSPEFMERMSDNGRYMLALQPFSYRQEATVAAIGRCLLDEFDRSGSITCELLDHAKFLIATRLLHLMDANQASKSSTLNATRLKPALELIHARSEDHITLAELAELCGVSIFHFARSFKARFGSAPLVYRALSGFKGLAIFYASRVSQSKRSQYRLASRALATSPDCFTAKRGFVLALIAKCTKTPDPKSHTRSAKSQCAHRHHISPAKSHRRKLTACDAVESAWLPEWLEPRLAGPISHKCWGLGL